MSWAPGWRGWDVGRYDPGLRQASLRQLLPSLGQRGAWRAARGWPPPRSPASQQLVGAWPLAQAARPVFWGWGPSAAVT